MILHIHIQSQQIHKHPLTQDQEIETTNWL